MQEWLNAQVFNTDLLNTFVQAIWWWLLSFPDLTKWVLWPLSPFLLSLSIIFWLFCLWVFIIMKVSPDFWSSLSRFPWMWSISMLKWKTWKAFFLQFWIISAIVFSTLWLLSWEWWWRENSAWWTIQSFFSWKNANIWPDDMVTVTIKPLEWIRITWIWYNWDWSQQNYINNDTSDEVLLKRFDKKWNEIKSKCNYKLQTKNDFKWVWLIWWLKQSWDDCVYPWKRQWMLITKSFSIQWNAEILNPVNIFITNDYDWVELRNSWNAKQWNFNAWNSVQKQNQTHSIVSVLRNKSSLSRSQWSTWEFIKNLNLLITNSNNYFYEEWFNVSWVKKYSWILRNMKNDMKWIYDHLLDLRKEIIDWNSREKIKRMIEDLWNKRISYISYTQWWKFDLATFIISWSIEEWSFNVYWDVIDKVMKSEQTFFGDFVIWWETNSLNSDFWTSFIFEEKIINFKTFSKNFYKFVNNTNNYRNYLIKKNSPLMQDYSYDHLKELFENKQDSELLKLINELLWISDSENFIYRPTWFLDSYYSSTLMSATDLALNRWKWLNEDHMKKLNQQLMSIWYMIRKLSSDDSMNISDLKENKNFWPFHINSELLVSNSINSQRISNWLENSLKNNKYENIQSHFSSKNIDELTNDHFKNIRESFHKTKDSVDVIYLNILEEKKELELSENKFIWDEYSVFFNNEFIEQFKNTWDKNIDNLIKTWDAYEDIVNAFRDDWKHLYYWVWNNDIQFWKNEPKDKLYWIWDNHWRIEKESKSFLWSLIWSLLSWDSDKTYVWVENWAWVEVRKWDIIFASPWTVIFALPYPIELMMSRELANTIEFIDTKWWIIWYYWDRYTTDKQIISYWIWREREVWKLTKWWLYNWIMETIDSSRESINWIFDPTIWFWVIESWFSRTFMILLTWILIAPAFLFFIFKNIALYFLSFSFFVFWIWLFLLDWQAKRVWKKILAWFISLALIPLYWYILMFILWKIFWDDKSFLYALRNFSTLWSIIICIFIAYIPIAIFFWTRKLLFSLIVDWKFDTSTLTVWNFLWAWVIMSEEKWRAIDNSIKRRFNDWKEKAKELWRKWFDKTKWWLWIWTAWNIWDWRNDTSNNEMLAELTDSNREAKEFDITNIDRSNWNFYSKADFASKSWLWFAWWNFDDIFIDDRDQINVWASKEEIQSLMKWSIIQNNTQLNKDKISWVTPDLINATNALREWLKSQWATDSDFARILLQMFDQNKDLLTNLTKAIQEVKNKSSDPVIKKKLNTSKNTLTSRDLEVLKSYKDLNQWSIKEELSVIFDKVRKWWFDSNDLDKIKALSSMSTILDNSDKETQFMNLTRSIQSTLSDLKRPDSEVERKISEFIMKWDMNWLNQYKMQNSHIQWLNEFINRVQMMPNEMMKVLNSHATAAQMRTNSQWINEFIWLMKNHSELEKMKHQDMNKYLSTMMQIQQFRNSSIEEKMNMASIQSVWSIQSIKESQKVTTMLSNEMSKLIQSQWNMSQQSITNIVTNIAWNTDISIRDQRDLANKLKDNLNKIREVNR